MGADHYEGSSQGPLSSRVKTTQRGTEGATAKRFSSTLARCNRRYQPMA